MWVGPKPIPLPLEVDVDNLEEAVTAPPAPLEDSSPAAAQEAVVSDPDKSEAEENGFWIPLLVAALLVLGGLGVWLSKQKRGI